MKTDVKLYNLIFPVWIMLTIPLVWLIVLPLNFIVDSLVIVISMKKLRIDNKKDFYKRHIFKIFWY